MSEAVRFLGVRRIVGVGLVVLIVVGVVSVPVFVGSARAEQVEGSTAVVPVGVRSEQEQMTELTVEGVGSRSVDYDGAIGRFTVSVLRDSLISAVSDGNEVVQAIADEVEKRCTADEPDDADDMAGPTCVSPSGLQTVSIRIAEETDWTEQGRVSLGFLYRNRLTISIRGTGFAGGLVDMVITSGGDNVRFDGLDFTVSRRSEFERLALLDAIDDARGTAQAIADHMGYEIVRIVRMAPGGVFDPYGDDSIVRAELQAAAEESVSVPTPVFGGAETVTSRVTMVFELRPLAQVEEETPG